MIDTRVNFDRAKTIIVTFVLKIINSEGVSKSLFTQRGFIRVNVETVKNFPYWSVVFICNLEK